LTLEFARMLGGSDEAALPLALAVEMIHNYSLVHDDLPCMDNDDMRRGKPSCHKAYGEATALLCGDALLTEAFGVICSAKALPDTAKVKAVALLSHYAGINGMIGGQQIDLMGEQKRLTKDEHNKMNLYKTGALIKCACLLGCIAAEADEKAFEIASVYGENIGLAFQVTDDLLDMGEEDSKTTYLTFMSVDAAKEYASQLTNGAINAVSEYKNSETLIALANFLQERTV
jgi:geranylgeranyl pyrophosphate synthase